MTVFFGLGKVLRLLRETAGLTLEEAGRKAHLDPGRLGRWERETTPNLDVEALGSLLDAYRADICDLGHLLRAETQPATNAAADSPFQGTGSQVLRDERVEEAVRSLVADALRGLRSGKT